MPPDTITLASTLILHTQILSRPMMANVLNRNLPVLGGGMIQQFSDNDVEDILQFGRREQGEFAQDMANFKLDNLPIQDPVLFLEDGGLKQLEPGSIPNGSMSYDALLVTLNAIFKAARGYALAPWRTGSYAKPMELGHGASSTSPRSHAVMGASHRTGAIEAQTGPEGTRSRENGGVNPTGGTKAQGDLRGTNGAVYEQGLGNTGGDPLTEKNVMAIMDARTRGGYYTRGEVHDAGRTYGGRNSGDPGTGYGYTGGRYGASGNMIGVRGGRPASEYAVRGDHSQRGRGGSSHNGGYGGEQRYVQDDLGPD